MERLEFNRARLAETQKIANIGAFEWDVRQDGQTWSDQLYRILGRPVGDPRRPDRNFFYANVVHYADAPRVRDALRRVLQGEGPVPLDCRIVRPGGVERMVSTVTRLEAAEDGAHTRVVGTVRDITEEWQSAKREHTQLQFVQTMMDAIPIPVYQKAPDGTFRACNDAWCRFTGKPRETMIGRTSDELIPGPHLEALHAQDRRLLERVGSDSIEIDLSNAAGELRHVLLHKASYAGMDGAIAGLVGAAFDITELRQTKDQLQHTITQLNRRNRVATLIAEFGEILQACLGIDETYEAIEKYLPRLLPGSAGVLYRLEVGHEKAERCAGWGQTVGTDAPMSTSDCVAIRRGQMRFVENSAKELNCRHLQEVPASYACLPLASHGELLALLHVQRGVDQILDRDADIEWAALRNVAEQLTLALANLAIRETLREQATRDKLTRLYNRHYFDARFEQEFARASRESTSIAVVMLDIDHFKRFNDTFGHAAGDHVLRELGAIVLGAARQSDVACRYGGEEFVLFMPGAVRDVARARAEEVRLAVKALRLEWEGEALGVVTVSAGVAAFPADADDAATLLKRADQALYRAKELGRDRVEVTTIVGGMVTNDSSRVSG
jgi:diguanylate cyclase (GGDEF)-like protein/PAS domain S-box-containing protein